MYFWYGSSHDGYRLKVDMCDEVAEDVLKLLQSKYPQFKPEDNHEMWLDTVDAVDAVDAVDGVDA